MFAAVILGVLALTGFVMGFKDSFSRPHWSSGRIPPPATDVTTAEPTPAVALADTTTAAPAEPEASATPASSAAPAKPKPKPKPDEDKAADQIGELLSSAPASSAAPPASSAQPPAPASDDELPPH